MLHQTISEIPKSVAKLVAKLVIKSAIMLYKHVTQNKGMEITCVLMATFNVFK